jgi:adenine-specific DNA-methyltransferase
MAWQLDHARAEDWLPQQADASADLILVDPPYFRVKDEPWDRQWDTAAGFLSWLDGLAAEWRRILKPNGSLYVFASPEMAARVEVLISERFNVLNSIRWYKAEGWHKKARAEDLRSYLSPWEAAIFAEPRQDATVTYLRRECERANLTPSQLSGLLGFKETGGSIGPRRYLSANGFAPISREHWDYLQTVSGCFRRPYDDVYRPFAAGGSLLIDRWDFAPVQPYPGKHPCEKPLPLLRHIISASTRPGALVLDCFAGSGNTGIAARQLGRDFIGCDASPVWAVRGARRVADAALQAELPLGAA